MGKEGYRDIDGMVKEGVVMVVLKRGAMDPGVVVDVGLLEVQEEMVLGVEVKIQRGSGGRPPPEAPGEAISSLEA